MLIRKSNSGNSAHVDAVQPGSAAQAAGFKPGDLVLTINGEKIKSFSDIQRIVGISEGAPLVIEVKRDNAQVTLRAVPQLAELKDNLGNIQRLRMLGISNSSNSYAVIDVASGKRLFPVGDQVFRSAAGALSRDGQLVYTANFGAVVQWQIDGGSRARECRIGQNNVSDMVASVDVDRLVVADQGGTVWLLDPVSCEAKKTSIVTITKAMQSILLRSET